MPSIVVDTREQRPYNFGPDVPVEVRALPTGDYSLAGFEDRVAVERKALGDFFHCVGGDRERFERELVRLAALEYAAVIVEGEFQDLERGPRTWRGARQGRTLSPSAIVGTLAAWSVRYRVPFFLVGSWGAGGELTYRLLRHFWRYSRGAPNPGPDAGGGEP